MAMYILVVGALGNLLQVGNSTFIAFLTTGLVAILFQPIRDRLQRGVNRMMYGERDNPVSVLSKLGEALENTGSPEDALSSITKTVAMTLKLPYVAIELGENHEIAASYGIPKDEVLKLPMLYQTETSGYLVVAPRSPGESFSASENQLLENIAHQAGTAAHAAKLTADLRISHQRLVTAREEERRRIRRDLHDGLGPQLASQTLTLAAVRRLLSEDPQAADELLKEAIKHAQTATEDIRRVVYDLRPPALDDLGLDGAIRAQAQRFESDKLQIDLRVPETMPSLPAAVEVACYLIFQEALTNVVRHANADRCNISITINDGLELEIKDDGQGLAQDHPLGVGLNSMRQRAEELGGSFQIDSSPHAGTRIITHLPLKIDED
jgi:signal transduction histidine kinase